MKYSIITAFLLLLMIPGFSQNPDNYYFGRMNPIVKKEKLPEAISIRDIIPELWINLNLDYKDRIELDNRRKTEYAVGYFLFPLEGYEMVIDNVSAEISATCNGKLLTSQSKGYALTAEQKNIINTADLGTDINIRIKFTYKNKEKDRTGSNDRIIEGFLAVTVVPETEAEFPGGFNYLTKYLMENIIYKISEQNAIEKIQQATVKFKVDETGKVFDVRLFWKSTDIKTDRLILDAMNKMPKWSPAENPKGTKVIQEFTIQLGGAGC